VEDDGPLLRIGLEDVAGTSWWASVLTTLTSQSGTAQLRFVGTVDGTGVYRGATFPAPRTLGSLPPDGQWAPGMTPSLRDLQRRVEADGWVQVGSGPEPWAFTYRRPEGDRSGQPD
jgi:hypothetical protein